MVVAHGETAVANQARHLCSERVRGKERAREKQTLFKTDKEDRDEEIEARRERQIYVEIESGWYGMGSGLGGIWVEESQTDRRNGAVAGSSG